MQRLSIAAAAIAAAALATATPVFAAPAAPVADASVRVPTSATELQSATGYVDLKQKIAAAAEAYCRQHPVDLTVATCKRDIAEALQAQAETQRQALLSRQTTFAQAQR